MARLSAASGASVCSAESPDVPQAEAAVTAASAPRVADPRAQRTRGLLQQALARLLETRDFEQLSVQAITAAAGLNRATFYAHYPDKFALLECMVADGFLSLLSSRGVRLEEACSEGLGSLVLGVCDYLERILDPAGEAVADQQLPSSPYGQNQLAPHLESALAVVLRQILMEGLKQYPARDGDSPGMLAATASWAIYGAAREWVGTPRRRPSQEIAAVIVRLVAPILRTAEVAAAPAAGAKATARSAPE